MRLVLAATVALIVGLTGGVLVGRNSVDPPPTPQAAVDRSDNAPNTPQPGQLEPSSTPTATVPPTAAPLLPALPAAEEELAAPVGLQIPRLGIDQSLIELGVTPDRKLEVPTNGSDIGWWRSGPVPGEAGGAVIAAHVTWNGGQPAVFKDLASLSPGDEVFVNREDGTVATYQVTNTEMYPKNAFPNEQIYRLDGDPELTLITCGGDFANGHYVDNVVVFADLVDDTRLDAAA